MRHRPEGGDTRVSFLPLHPLDSVEVVRKHGVDACPDRKVIGSPAFIGPVRTCVGCRERAPKSELLRVVAGSDANGPAVVPDPDGTAHGRGAHLHPTTACYDLAERRRAFSRALRLESGLSSAPVREHIDSLSTRP